MCCWCWCGWENTVVVVLFHTTTVITCSFKRNSLCVVVVVGVLPPSSSPPHCLFLGSFGALPFFWLFRCSVFLCFCVCVCVCSRAFCCLRVCGHPHTTTQRQTQKSSGPVLRRSHKFFSRTSRQNAAVRSVAWWHTSLLTVAHCC